VGTIGFESGVTEEVRRRNPANQWYKNAAVPQLFFLIACITKTDCLRRLLKFSTGRWSGDAHRHHAVIGIVRDLGNTSAFPPQRALGM